MSAPLVTRDEVAAFLRQEGLQVDAGEAPDRVVFAVDHQGLETTGTVVWPPDVALASVVLPLPFAVLDDTVPALCEATVRLNHLLVLPGFGVDLDGGVVYFRASQGRDGGGALAPDALRRLLHAAMGTAARFGPLLALVASGQLSAAELDQAVGGP